MRILLVLAFGLAFGIEGMTLIRSFVINDDGEDETEQTTEQLPTLREGDVLLSLPGPPVRVHRLRLLARDEAWTFSVISRPDSSRKHPYTLTFDHLTTGAETTAPSAPSYTWSPNDTSAFEASWPLPPGRRPATLTVTGTLQVSADSTASATRTVDVSHVPVRMR